MNPPPLPASESFGRSSTIDKTEGLAWLQTAGVSSISHGHKRGSMKILACVAIAAVLLMPLGSRGENTPEIFRKADLEQGARLLAENQCAACHTKKVGGDGSSIYRPTGRVNNPGILRGTVEQCNTNLSLSLFPEEVTDIAAVLNRDYYRFTK